MPGAPSVLTASSSGRVRSKPHEPKGHGFTGPGAALRSGSREEFSTLQAAREAYERDYILKELDRTHGNISRAAEALGLERSHLYRKMKTLGIHLGE